MKKARILVVDDDRLVLASIADMLIAAGYRVLKATSGAEAMELCAEVPPDLVVMDVRMPGMSGIEATRAIREKAAVPVLFLSAFDDCETVRDAIAEGGLSYLVKPVGATQLAAAIEAALARAKDIQALRRSEENLRIALQGDRNVSIAVGLLMERYRLSESDAFEKLRRHARSSQRKLSETARDIVIAADTINLPDV